MLLRLSPISLLAAVVAISCSTSQFSASPLGTTSQPLNESPSLVTAAADALRTSWYDNQSGLTPSTVGSSFGQLFKTSVTGQVYAQPLVSNGTLFIATEANNIYGLNPTTGSQHWTRNLGTPFNMSDIGGCTDLLPTAGITGTPVIDGTNGIAYLLSKTYDGSGNAVWFAHAVNLADGSERAGFPVQIKGNASNDSGTTFSPKFQAQRPGLLLMNGVVYAAFGSHCDVETYHGWIVGISTGGAITTMWSTTVHGATESAIWAPGGGLASDGNNQILFTTGNGVGADLSNPTPGNQPPQSLTEAIVRVNVQGNGGLAVTDFFEPSNEASLDSNDADLGSGGALSLPSPYFGTSTYPNLLFQVGKDAVVRLLNRNNLGGYKTGPSQGDNTLYSFTAAGGLWGKPAAWGGDGGYIYYPATPGEGNGPLLAIHYGLTGSGNPTLSSAGQSAESYGFSSGSPVVTSNGATSGTALVWIIGANDRSGAGGTLRAYDPVPVNGRLNLRFSAPIGTAAKFASPGIDSNRLYVGTRDGNVYGFGVTGQGTGGPVQSGVVYEIVNKNSGECADITGASTAAGGTLNQYPYKGQKNQQWTFSAVGDGSYVITNVNSGLVLDLNASNATNGTVIQQSASNGGNNQHWLLNSQGSGYYTITSKATGGAIDVAGSSTANSALCVEETPSGTASQLWQFVPTSSPVTAGVVYKLINQNSGEAADITGGSTRPGGTLNQYPYSSYANQKWTFSAVGDGSYVITNVNSGLVLDVPAANATNGTQIQQWTPNNGGNQHWFLKPSAAGFYTITAAFSGKAIDVAQSSTANSALCVEEALSGSTSQNWSIVPAN